MKSALRRRRPGQGPGCNLNPRAVPAAWGAAWTRDFKPLLGSAAAQSLRWPRSCSRIRCAAAASPGPGQTRRVA